MKHNASYLTKKIKGLALLLAALLVFVGCQTGSGESSGQGDSSNGSPEPVGAMGRYVEEPFALPEGIGYVNGFNQLEDGTYRLFANSDLENMLGIWKVWESTDGGKTWTSLALPWLKEVEGLAVLRALFVSPDETYLYYERSSDEDDKKLMELFNAGADEEAMLFQRENQHFAKATAEELVDLPYLPTGDEFYMTISDLMVADDTSLWANFYSSLKRIDKETGKELTQIDIVSDYGNAPVLAWNNKLYVTGNKSIQIYDNESGELLETINIGETEAKTEDGFFSYSDSMSQLVAASANEDLIYYLDSSGICAISKDGVLVERLVDGSLTSLSMPSIDFSQFFYNKDDNSFTIVARQENHSKIYRYSYDASVPTVPSKELTVYSLKQNDTIQQAIGMYQLANPDTKVTLEVGTTGKDGITAADALRNLSTEILAGKGPDVLVLDGMPIASYQKKGILKDLTDTLGDTHGLLPFIIENAKTDGGIYAVPARFSTYLTLGNNVGELTDLADILAWYGTQGNVPLGIFTEDLSTLYPAYSQEWFSTDGGLNTEALRKTLDDLAALGDSLDNATANDFQSVNDFVMAAMLFKYKRAALGIGTLQSFNDLQLLYSGMKERGEGEINLYPAGAKKYYEPHVLLGVNAQSTLTADAEAFVKYVLSKDVLVSQFSDGLATNWEALKETAKDPYPEGDDGMFYTMSRAFNVEDATEEELAEIPDPDQDETFDLPVNWPEPEWMDEFLTTLQTLNTPVLQNQVIDEIVEKELEKFLTEGTQSAAETASNIEQALALYLAEQ